MELNDLPPARLSFPVQWLFSDSCDSLMKWDSVNCFSVHFLPTFGDVFSVWNIPSDGFWNLKHGDTWGMVSWWIHCKRQESSLARGTLGWAYLRDSRLGTGVKRCDPGRVAVLVPFFSGDSVHTDLNVLSAIVGFACKGFCVVLTQSAYLPVWMRLRRSFAGAVDGWSVSGTEGASVRSCAVGTGVLYRLRSPGQISFGSLFFLAGLI